MTIDELNIQCHKTVVFFVNYDVLPSSCCWCTNIYYVTTLTGSRSCELRIAPGDCAWFGFVQISQSLQCLAQFNVHLRTVIHYQQITNY